MSDEIVEVVLGALVVILFVLLFLWIPVAIYRILKKPFDMNKTPVPLSEKETARQRMIDKGIVPKDRWR